MGKQIKMDILLWWGGQKDIESERQPSPKNKNEKTVWARYSTGSGKMIWHIFRFNERQIK